MHAAHGEEKRFKHASSFSGRRRRQSTGDIDVTGRPDRQSYSRFSRHLLVVALSVALPSSTGVRASGTPLTIRGVLRQHHKVVLNLVGPYASEEDLAHGNPFLDYRFDVVYSTTTTTDDGPLGESDPVIHRVTVPGYFAADGNASESSAVSGNVWRCVFRPPTVGLWTATVTFAETQPAKDARNARLVSLTRNM